MANHKEPIYVISIAAEMAGMHPQTLRQYDRLGILKPARTRGRGRRYSVQDIEKLREVQKLSQTYGINLAGIQRILDLEFQLEQKEAEIRRLQNKISAVTRVFIAGSAGEVQAIPRGTRPKRDLAMAELVRHRITTAAAELVLWSPKKARH